MQKDVISNTGVE